ncbi:MAG TPA: ECF-type sigma factor [Terriglobales bacterium]|nr:ECF-type sigma factor [Terriglobales bacterium]
MRGPLTAPAACDAGDASGSPDLGIFRDRTCGLLRRYAIISLEVGRLPSLLGRELIRSRNDTRVPSFEDAVIFVHDVERCLKLLDPWHRRLIACMVFQNYSQHEAARVLHCSPRTVRNRFPEAVDELTRLFVERGLLRFLVVAPSAHDVPESCQEGENEENSASEWEESEYIF